MFATSIWQKLNIPRTWRISEDMRMWEQGAVGTKWNTNNKHTYSTVIECRALETYCPMHTCALPVLTCVTLGKLLASIFSPLCSGQICPPWTFLKTILSLQLNLYQPVQKKEKILVNLKLPKCSFQSNYQLWNTWQNDISYFNQVQQRQKCSKIVIWATMEVEFLNFSFLSILTFGLLVIPYRQCHSHWISLLCFSVSWICVRGPFPGWGWGINADNTVLRKEELVRSKCKDLQVKWAFLQLA